MVLFCFLWCAALYFFAFKIAGSEDVFSPLKFVAIKYALLNLPFILFIYFNPESFFRKILTVCNVSLGEAFFKYTIVQTVAFLSLISGIIVYTKWKGRKSKQVYDGIAQYNYKTIKIIALSFLIIGLGSYGVYLYRIGGLTYLLTHLDKRIELQSGQFILQLLIFLSFAVLLLMLCIRLRNKMADKLLFMFSLIIAGLVFSSFGARKNTLILIIIVIVAYHYVVKKIELNRRNKIVFVMLSAALVFYILIVPALRKKDVVANLDTEQFDVVKVLKIKNFVYNISYTFIDVFAANYYNANNAWYMAGFTDPVKALATPGNKELVPPVDQGVYFFNVVYNQKDYRPPMDRGAMDKNSWPIENFGFGYANFLLPGVILFFFLQGVIFAFFYGFLKQEITNPILVYLYVFVVFNFNFSNLRLVQCIMSFPAIIGCYYLLRILRNKNPDKSNYSK